jgi:flagellar biosynthesis/type III secretory pathway protein FliH
MAILSGLISEQMPLNLIARRKDMIMESAAYGIIKQDGIVEGIEIGLQKGIQQGVEQGKKEGKKEGIEKGELIGKIQMAERFLKHPITPESVFIKQSIKKLKATLAQLETQLDEKLS